jgi:hypothetical protein
MQKFISTLFFAALVAISAGQSASAHPRHVLRRQPPAMTEQFRNANNAVIVVPATEPASMYSGGWSAPAGR